MMCFLMKANVSARKFGSKFEDKIFRTMNQFNGKSDYQYQQAKEQPDRFYNIVDNQLKLNRKILKEFNKGGKVIVRAELINELGFDPNFFTHYWKNKKGEVYLFVYEYGFMKIKEATNEKYILVLWQEYMNKPKNLN